MIVPHRTTTNNIRPKQSVPLTVSYLQRKPRPNQNYSLEFIFDDVRHRLSGNIRPTVHRAPFYSKGIIRRALIALSAAFHQGDLNHITGDINFASLLLSRKRTLLTILDAGVMDGKQGVRKALLDWLWFRLPAKSAQMITTISESAKKDILKYVNVPEDKIRVIPVAVSPHFEWWPKDFDSSCPRILQVGTKANKNIKRLIPALSGLSCKLQIIGPLTNSLRAQLNANGIEYENWSNLALNDVVKKYQQCDLLTFCSTYEGFGMPIVEANAVGRPVVTSDISSMPEVAGNAACLVDPFDIASIRAGIKKVIDQPEYRKRLVENGKANATRFDPHAIANQYLELYEELNADSQYSIS